MEKTLEAALLARLLMREHGLSDWSFELDNARRRAGLCSHRRRTISLSRHYVAHNDWADIRDTLLHEIAHGLVGPGHGHDHAWKAVCLRIGARPVRCYGEHVVMPKGRYRAVCPGCSKEFHRHRRVKPERWLYCRACGPERGRLHYAIA